MEIGDAILLGIIQGLTEFLPISSSGHLVLGKAILGIREPDIIFEVFVHFGTLLAVITAFRADLLQMIQSFFSILKDKTPLQEKYHSDANLRLIVYIVLGTVPAVILGFLIKDYIESAFSNPRMVSGMLIVTAVLLFGTLFQSDKKRDLGLLTTFIMGIAQALAIFPGISRSGSTISFGLYLKVDGNQAARFSFLLAIPAILGATLLEAHHLMEIGLDQQRFLNLWLGTLFSFISGYFAIEALLGIVRKGKLYLFAPYCLVLGIIGLLYF